MKITDGKGVFKLNNGIDIPYIGLGVFKMQDGNEVISSVKYALEIGYRHIDTASLYGNEKGVGEAVNQSDIGRENIFVTSKVWNSDHGYDETIKAFYRSLDRLRFEYLDLYLIHWPVEGKYIDTWKALEHLYSEGRIKSIGVSNFLQHHLEVLEKHSKITPMVNQMEFHPYLVQQDLLDYCKNKGIQYEAWSPLMQGHILNNSTIHKIANRYNKSVAQVILRWDIQKGVVAIPKSSNYTRISENFDLFDFELSKDDIRLIDSLDKSTRIGADPNNFNF